MSDDAIRDLMNKDVEEEIVGTQYLTFVLDNEIYGIKILAVQEILAWESATRVPNSPHYVKGVLNLRGTIVPVFDMRVRFNFPEAEYNKETVVIVVQIKREKGEQSIGLIVDGVSDVLNVVDEEIGVTPEFGAGVPTENIKGLVSRDNKMVMLLDTDSLAIEEQQVV